MSVPPLVELVNAIITAAAFSDGPNTIKEIIMDLTETQIGSEPIFNGTFVTIACDTVRLPNGNDSKRIVIRHPGAACVLAETPDNKIVFVHQ